MKLVVIGRENLTTLEVCFTSLPHFSSFSSLPATAPGSAVFLAGGESRRRVAALAEHAALHARRAHTTRPPQTAPGAKRELKLERSLEFRRNAASARQLQTSRFVSIYFPLRSVSALYRFDPAGFIGYLLGECSLRTFFT